MYNAIKFLNKEITGVSSSKREEEVMSMRHEQGMHGRMEVGFDSSLVLHPGHCQH